MAYIAYSFGFDISTIGTMQVVIGGAVGSGTASVTGKKCHRNLSSITEVSDYTSFSTAVIAALNAAVPATWGCSLNLTTWVYTITCNTAFTLTWTGDAGTRLRLALGYVSTPTASGLSAVGTIRPYYLMVGEIVGRSGNPKPYEPAEIASESVSDGGPAYSVSIDTDELWSDWYQPCEPKEAVFTRHAPAAIPWTWQAAWKHARAEQPFALDDTAAGDALVYRMRAEGASFVPQPVEADVDDLWNMNFECRELGSL